jgi:hypothetical protein
LADARADLRLQMVHAETPNVMIPKKSAMAKAAGGAFQFPEAAAAAIQRTRRGNKSAGK